MKKYHFKRHLFFLIFFLFNVTTILAEDKISIVKVGVFQHAPLVYIDDKGSPQGLFVDVIEAIASEEGWKLEYIKGTWNEGLDRVKISQIDLMTAVMHLPRRESFLDFPKESVFNIWGQLYIHKDANISGIFDLEGKTIGILKGGANGENFINLTNKLKIQCKVIPFDSQKDIAEAINKKNVDAGVFTNIHGYEYQQSHKLKTTQIVFDPSYLKFATTEGANQQLLSTIDKYLSKWKSDRNSIYYTIIEKYFGISESKKIPKWVWWFVIAGASILGITLISGFILVIFNKKLKTMVKEKTLELISANKNLSENENRLKKSEEKYRELIEGTEDLITHADKQGNFTFVNHVAEKILGFPPKKCIGMSAFQFIHPDDRDMTIEWFNECVVHKKKQMKIENRQINAKTGESHIVLWSTSFHFDDSDLLIGVGSIGRDITERKQAEEALQENEQKFRSVFENSPLAIVHFDKLGVVTACNENFCKILGSTLNKIIGFDTKKDLKEESMVSAISNALAGHKSQYEGDYLSVTGGIRTPVRALFAPIISDNSEISGVIGIFEDITEQLTTEREKLKLMVRLQQSQKMESIGTLAGGIAHDFNNILFPIIGYAEILQEDLPENSPEQKNIIEILHAALRAKDLVKQILAFSRQSDQKLKPVRLQSILKEALKLLKSSIPTTIDFQTEIDPDCGLVVADPSQIHQIVMNLTTNAYHAMQESGGQIKVSLKQTEIDSTPLGFSELLPGKYAILKVTDTGKGIKKEIMDKIFEPYFTTKETGKGTGLGLSVVQGIVKNCQGNIHVYSEPGEGTEFHVYLPIIKTVTKIDNSADPFESIQGGSERILLVDDEEMIVKMEKQVLERLGYYVTTRTGSTEALETFKSNPNKFDLIISDMTMPSMTGVQLCNEIKKIRPDIPVIICTGFSDQINEETSKKLGIQGYVVKPVIKREIAKTIRNVLNIKML